MNPVNKISLGFLISSLIVFPLLVFGQEGIFLKEEEAPKAVFPEATAFERRVIPSEAKLQELIKQRMSPAKTSLWESSYTTFIAKRGASTVGYAVIVEEIGKHRPITFIVGVGLDGKVKDVALMVYREPYGGEVRDERFLAQYQGKDLKASLLPYRDIRNITGATLSAEAIGRGTKKALALVEIIYLQAEGKK
jgi:Na+-translocating ferredoxin:NAD+ oxidoreductase RnfG subunit